MPGLYDPAEHRPLAGPAWRAATARAAIEAIAGDAIAAYRGPAWLWPNAPGDLEGEPDVPMRCAYLGAAGVAWALWVLSADGLAPALPGIEELARALPAGYAEHPEFTEMPGTGGIVPPPSLLFGESGVRLAAEAIVGDGAQLDALRDLVVRNARNPTTELCWGSPSTMTAALELWRTTGDDRWRAAWLWSAGWLIAQWHGPVWVQELYGQTSRYLGAGHGFAGTAWSLLAGRDLLGDATAAELTDRIRATLSAFAQTHDGLTQWPGLADRTIERRPVQWCHGAPGIVTSLASLPADGTTDRLLAGGGELTWRAGPLRKGPGLCHGTAGNGFALLALYRRTGDQRWLERARAFAMDAAADVARRRAEAGRGRYTLWTGDLGVALYLRACLTGDARFPWLEGALDMAGPPAPRPR